MTGTSPELAELRRFRDWRVVAHRMRGGKITLHTDLIAIVATQQRRYGRYRVQMSSQQVPRDVTCPGTSDFISMRGARFVRP